MQTKSSTKSIVIFAALILVTILAYFYFSGTPVDTSAQLVTEGEQASEVTLQATKIVTLLNQTSSLRIDPALFKTAVYKSLVDHTVPVVEQQVGKDNPFFYTVAPPAKPR